MRFVGPELWEGAKSGKLWDPPEPNDTEMIDVDVPGAMFGGWGVKMEM